MYVCMGNTKVDVTPRCGTLHFLPKEFSIVYSATPLPSSRPSRWLSAPCILFSGKTKKKRNWKGKFW